MKESLRKTLYCLVLAIWLLVGLIVGLYGLKVVNEIDKQKNNKSASKLIPNDLVSVAYGGVIFSDLNEFNTFIKSSTNDIPNKTSNPIDMNVKFLNDEESKKSTNIRMEIAMDRNEVYIAPIGNISILILTILTAMAFGVLGSITRIFRDMLKKKVSIIHTHIVIRPIFSMLIAFLVFGVLKYLPWLIQSIPEGIELTFVKPSAICFLCFFSGMLSEEVYDYLKSTSSDFFKIRNKMEKKYE